MNGWLAAVLLGALPVAGPVTVHGRVVRIIAGDTVVAGGARVVLHAVTTEQQGPVDSVVADARGEFRLQATIDSGAVMLLSARWQGVEYFAPPFAQATDPVTVIAVDTSSTQSVRVSARHVILGGPAPDGARDVVDLVVIDNPGEFTRVGGDSLTPTWRMALPPNIANVTVGDADFSPQAFDVHGDTLFLHAPIPPGERQFFLMYQVAPGALELRVPLQPRPDTISLLTEERQLPTLPGLTDSGDETVSGRSFRRQSGGAAVGDPLVITLTGQGGVPDWFLPTLVGLFGLALVAVTVRALARSRPAS
jgi:hypothetical protein